MERARVTAYDNRRRVTEADLSGHLDNINGDAETKDKKPASALLSRDNQLYEALTLLKGLNVLGMRDKKTNKTGSAAKGES